MLIPTDMATYWGLICLNGVVLDLYRPHYVKHTTTSQNKVFKERGRGLMI